jgi:hypothetical protein
MDRLSRWPDLATYRGPNLWQVWEESALLDIVQIWTFTYVAK